jgi:hypothetical protein
VIQPGWVYAALAALLFQGSIYGQLDPEKRRLIQLGYNQPLQGRAPIAAYGFYYYNNPEFINTNMVLRLAIAPIYLDGELGFKGLISENTDLGIGIAGGGFADTYSEIRRGNYTREESFTGHGGEFSVSVYHRFNPDWLVPLWWLGRASIHRSVFEEDSDTAQNFELPPDFTSYNFRTGLRLGGREPTMTSPLAAEVSIWYQLHVRAENGTYGFNGDRELEAQTHLFWGRTLLKYTFEESQQYFDVGLTFGASVNPDRLSAYRLGGILPFVSEFPLSIPGYYFQEISVEKFALLNAEYSFPFTPGKHWRLNLHGAVAPVDYLNGLEQEDDWHSGVGAAITYVSPRQAWFVSLVYGHGFQAIRHDDKGADQVGVLFQYDFEAVKRFPFRPFEPRVTPYGSRGGERIFR